MSTLESHQILNSNCLQSTVRHQIITKILDVECFTSVDAPNGSFEVAESLTCCTLGGSTWNSGNPFDT